MHQTLPTEPQELAIWLFDNLEEVSYSGAGGLWEGRLPPRFDFNQVEQHVEQVSERLHGVCSEPTKTIGFHPKLVGVFDDLPDLLSVESNRRHIPERFVVRSLSYHYPPKSELLETPKNVSMYLDAVRLSSALRALSDLPDHTALLFVASHDSQLEIRSDFTEEHLHPLPSLGMFAAEFTNHAAHADQKRAIVRATLIDHFRPRRAVTLGDVLGAFESIATDARRSFAMYMAEFSVKKVLGEVERQNLEDTLSLNKTLSDIQNQLLALPAAILLAGATIKPEEPIRNYAVLVGMVVFCIFIWVLVGNQRHSIQAIADQVDIRKRKVESMPSDSGHAPLTLFPALESRVGRQKRTLTGIAMLVGVVAMLTIGAVVNANHDGVVLDGLVSTWRWLVVSLQADADQ